MQHPTTMIHWADISSTEVVEDTFSALYQHYSIDSAYVKIDSNHKDIQNISEIDFSNRNVKLKDWYGWTQLLKLRRVETKYKICWEELRVANSSLIVSLDTIVPAYSSPVDYILGFHGERKYPFTPKPYKDMDRNEYLRIRGGFAKGREVEFTNDIDISSLKEGNHYFSLETLSGTFNANQVYMIAS